MRALGLSYCMHRLRAGGKSTQSAKCGRPFCRCCEATVRPSIVQAGLLERAAGIRSRHSERSARDTRRSRPRAAPATREVKNTAAFDRCHLGMDLPLGGLGNPAPTGHLDVGPAGVPFKRAKRKGQQPEFMSNIQHGHLYMRWDDFGEKKISSLLSHMSSSTFGTASIASDWGARASAVCRIPEARHKSGGEEVSNECTPARARANMLLGL